ncbi:MAG: hypothetical protein QOF89_1080 [Acidobacteriota bacterium]|jgi:hypothetical protein|nr:hypothetical protein [Acidobacteriota bacterium]
MAKRISVLVALLLLAAGGAGAAGWGWKLATTPDDVMNFLNGTPPYKGAHNVVKITATNKGSNVEFIVFYQAGGTKGWGWKRATTTDDALNFLNAKPPYKPLKTAAVASANSAAGTTEFYIFYKLK